MELVDIGDSKSPALKSVPVRVRPLVPNNKTLPRKRWGFLFGAGGRRVSAPPVRLIAKAIWTRNAVKAPATQVLIASKAININPATGTKQ